MPVVLRVAGYKFFFYQADVANEPPHLHVTALKNPSQATILSRRVDRRVLKFVCVSSR